MGNQAAQRLLGEGVIQAKLTVNQPGDRFEQEADRVAEEVMRMPEPQALERAAISGSASPTRIQRVCRECDEELSRRPVAIQRMCPGCEEELHRQPMEEEEEEETIQAKEISGRTPEVTPAVQAQINGLRGGGHPLPESVRAFFEPRFGHDFSQVRVHTDGRAAGSARAVNALAYTVGRDVVFGTGQYKPGTMEGHRLLAHELTHVVQQGGGTIQKASLPTNDDIGLETESDEMRAKALAHDLKHTVQQETSANIHSPNRLGIKWSVPDGSSSLQRVADKSNPPSNMPCSVDTGPGAPGGTHVVFAQGRQTLNAAETELIAAEFQAWVARGRVDAITVDGFGSSEGSPGANWRLSCNRAEAVKAEFVRLGVPTATVTTVAHGETEEFSATDLAPNRRAVIRVVPAQQLVPSSACPTTITENTTLSTDCPGRIAIAADNVILDCAGHTLTGPRTGNGIELRGRRGVRVVNCRVTNFDNGFALRDSGANTFSNNSSFENIMDGFDINDSNGNIFIQNDASRNDDHGIELDGSSDNLFIRNTVSGNVDGFDTEGPPRRGAPAPRNRFVHNTADDNRGSGFRMLSDANEIRGNSSTNNDRDGYRIQGNTNNLRDNVGSNNDRDGFRIEGNDNTLSGNSGNGNQSQDLDVRNNTTGNTCTRNTLGNTNGQCPPDFP